MQKIAKLPKVFANRRQIGKKSAKKGKKRAKMQTKLPKSIAKQKKESIIENRKQANKLALEI